MRINVSRAAEILNKTPDELMFDVQSREIVAHINEDNLTWEFELDSILEYKKILEMSVES